MVDSAQQVWQRILQRNDLNSSTSLRDHFAQDLQRAEHFTRIIGDGNDEIVVDFSKQLIDAQLLDDLLDLAEAKGVIEKFRAMRNGAKINSTEHRPALHTALRSDKNLVVDGEDIATIVKTELESLYEFAELVRKQNKIKRIVNIGIGGSDLGPALVYDALLPVYPSTIECKFVNNLDSHQIHQVLKSCVASETLFIVCSKSFNTSETLANAKIARDWLAEQLNVEVDDLSLAKHFVVISVFPERAQQMQLQAATSFKIWPWVGGRYSIASAMSLAPIIAYGPEVFHEFLGGMKSVDDHMESVDPKNNLPLLLGLIDVYNYSVRNFSSQAVIPYSSQLKLLPDYLQQLIMESNGKSVLHDGTPTSTRTSPIVWGGVGTSTQHSFFQMLHQGYDIAPVDFIGFAQPQHRNLSEHDQLTANMFAQAQGLAFGITCQELQLLKVAEELLNHHVTKGNRPSTTFLAVRLTARTLGALIAIYEHRVFVQGVIWDINSFDQFGVELGKTLALQISQLIAGKNDQNREVDSSTRALLAWYSQNKAR